MDQAFVVLDTMGVLIYLILGGLIASAMSSGPFLRGKKWTREARGIVIAIFAITWIASLLIFGLYYFIRHIMPSIPEAMWNTVCFLGRGFRDIYRIVIPARKPKVVIPKASIVSRKDNV